MPAAPAQIPFTSLHEDDLLRSGPSAGRSASARVGFLPLALEHIVLQGLASIPVYLRTLVRRSGQAAYQFTLYSSPATLFTERHRTRLREAGVKFIYITLQNQMQFRRQVEAHLAEAMTDPALTINARSELVYETSVELIDELFLEQDLGEKLPRLESVAKAVTTLVMQDTAAFSHLFAASQHDFYTATHMVNVGTWMVPLAYALGIEDMNGLNLMCLAGMVHDIGKIFIPEEVLNKMGRLGEADFNLLRQHPALGRKHLQTFKDMPDLVLHVAHEHHERMDGTGYPQKLTGEQIHLASRICAVVDSFDAMTSFRPFKTHTNSFSSALAILQREAGTKYDARIVAAWINLMQRAEKDGLIDQPLAEPANPGLGRRVHERFAIECPGRIYPMEMVGEQWNRMPALEIAAHNLSRSGLGFLCRQAIQATQYVQVTLLGQGTLADREFEGQVVRCRAFSDGWHEIGMQFASHQDERRAAENAAINPVPFQPAP